MTDNPEKSDDAPAEKESSSGTSTLGRFGTVAVGLVLLIFGLSMVIPQGETGNSGMERALGALVTALGGGVIATVLLPHSLELDGKQVKPFGVDLKASGGAAVFVLSLLFAYFGAQVFGDVPSPAPTPTPSETAKPEANPETTPATDDAGETETPDSKVSPTPQQTEKTPTPPAIPDQRGQLDNYIPDEAQQATGLYRYATYCPLQCPDGPEFCPSLAWGQHAQRITAQEIAVSYCVGAGGDETCCRSNLEAF